MSMQYSIVKKSFNILELVCNKLDLVFVSAASECSNLYPVCVNVRCCLVQLNFVVVTLEWKIGQEPALVWQYMIYIL
jgi:hypothetical protein